MALSMSIPLTKGDKKSAPRWRTYLFAIVTTLLIWSMVGYQGGWDDLMRVIILSILEISLSFDNAVVNVKYLDRMSTGWQLAFMTLGILFAVFIVRFALPIFIVQLTSGLSFLEVGDLALHNPNLYEEHLVKAGPLISTFGGIFLVVLGLGYFFNNEKKVHWLGQRFEGKLAAAGKFDNVALGLMVLVAVVMYFTIPGGAALRGTVLVAAACGILLHLGLDFLEELTERSDVQNKVIRATGAAAAVLFGRLEVIDASCSFDGVIGAFAITTSVVLIAAGLAVGAVWVRSMTVDMQRRGTMDKYCYLEHGAMYALVILGGTMLAKVYHLEAPEWATGSIGAVCIIAAVISSKLSPAKEEAA